MQHPKMKSLLGIDPPCLNHSPLIENTSTPPTLSIFVTKTLVHSVYTPSATSFPLWNDKPRGSFDHWLDPLMVPASEFNYLKECGVYFDDDPHSGIATASRSFPAFSDASLLKRATSLEKRHCPESAVRLQWHRGHLKPSVNSPDSSHTVVILSTIVFIPPQFLSRIYAFYTLMYLAFLFGHTLCVFVPVVVGRMVLRNTIDLVFHDMYSFMIGVFVVYLLCRILIPPINHVVAHIHTHWLTRKLVQDVLMENRGFWLQGRRDFDIKSHALSLPRSSKRVYVHYANLLHSSCFDDERIEAVLSRLHVNSYISWDALYSVVPGPSQFTKFVCHSFLMKLGYHVIGIFKLLNLYIFLLVVTPMVLGLTLDLLFLSPIRTLRNSVTGSIERIFIISFFEEWSLGEYFSIREVLAFFHPATDKRVVAHIAFDQSILNFIVVIFVDCSGPYPHHCRHCLLETQSQSFHAPCASSSSALALVDSISALHRLPFSSYYDSV